MAFVHANRVSETSTTTGTGTYNLAGVSAADFQTFVAGIGTTNTCYYAAYEAAVGWEVGIGTVTDATPDTLARTRVFASSNGGAAVNWGSGTRTIICTGIALGRFPQGHIYGLGMSNAADTINDITVAAGECRDDTDQVDLVLSAAITKQLEIAWAVGTAAGALNTGAVANGTWYEVHLIRRTDTGVVDVMTTTTANRATLPANYTHKRRIGWVRRGTDTNLQFSQNGSYFTLITRITDAQTSATATAAAITLTVPPSCIARFRVAATSSASINTAQVTVFSEIIEGDVTPDDQTGIASIGYMDIIGAAAGHVELRVSATSTIEHDSDAAVSSFNISTFGWIDDRGRETGA